MPSRLDGSNRSPASRLPTENPTSRGNSFISAQLAALATLVAGDTGNVASEQFFEPVVDAPGLDMPAVDVLLFCQDAPVVLRGVQYYAPGQGPDSSLVQPYQLSIDGGATSIGVTTGGFKWVDQFYLGNFGLTTIFGSQPNDRQNPSPVPTDAEYRNAVTGVSATHGVRIAGYCVPVRPQALGMYTVVGGSPTPAPYAYWVEWYTEGAVLRGVPLGIFNDDPEGASGDDFAPIVLREDQYTAAIAANGNIVEGTINGRTQMAVVVGLWALTN